MPYRLVIGINTGNHETIQLSPVILVQNLVDSTVIKTAYRKWNAYVCPSISVWLPVTLESR